MIYINFVVLESSKLQVSLKSVHRFRRTFFKGFYHIWAWRPSWSCDLDFLYTHWFPLPIDASLGGQAVSEKKIFENGGRRTDDEDGRMLGACLSYKLTCEPSAQVS